MQPGDIVVLAGIEEVKIGDTISNAQNRTPLPRIRVDEPTVSMNFTINDSPFGGKEGKYVQSSRIRERLRKETLLNVAIQVEESSATGEHRGQRQGGVPAGHPDRDHAAGRV